MCECSTRSGPQSHVLAWGVLRGLVRLEGHGRRKLWLLWGRGGLQPCLGGLILPLLQQLGVVILLLYELLLGLLGGLLGVGLAVPGVLSGSLGSQHVLPRGHAGSLC